jgi:osmotically-inducible protein OsmY
MSSTDDWRSVGRGGFSRRHQGRPPKGYERSDERIREMLSERLMEEPSIDAGDVSISVSSGRVSLEGTVLDRTEVQDNTRVSAGGSAQSSEGSTKATKE